MTAAILVTGGGGVGKTTVAAGLAVAAADRGLETLVLTVDPARRLATALGIERLGNTPSRTAGRDHLWAAMLDATASWEAIVHRHATPDVAERLIANEFFRAIADRFPAGQSYAAAEQTAEFLESGEWDLVIVDTPPAAGGIDFFLAPGRIRSLIGSRVLRWLTGAGLPGRRRLYRWTTRPALRAADAVLGGHLLQDVAEFLMDLRTIYDGVSRRARHIERHLRRATSIVVTTADPAPLGEAARFFRELPAVAAEPRLIVFNRSLPREWMLPPPPVPASGALKKALEDNLQRWAEEAQRRHDLQTDFATRYDTELGVIPWLPHPPTSLDELAAMMDVATGLDLAALDVPNP